ncbi:MAG: DMT family transporter [Clostridia bacterium]|jgi:drug/metabolite transporter (DMT)-like permease|nr:DMT family transporter [Clostridia bacterium]MCI2015332.1 DMT family transporter [Clostridia bacterium]
MNVKKSYFKYFVSLFMFGTNGIVASYIALSSYEIVFSRTLIGCLFLILIFALKRKHVNMFKNKRHALCLIFSGISMGISWMFLYEAYKRIGVSVASLAYYCGPVIVIALSPLLFKEKLTWPKVLGFLAVITGMFCVNINSLNEAKTTWGLFCGIMSAVMYAFMIIFNKKAEGITGIENSMWQLIASFVTVAVFVCIKQGFVIHTPLSWIPIMVLGIFNTGIGCYLYFSSIGSLRVQTVSICGYIEPLSAVIFSALFLNESMSMIQIIGVLLIIGGAVFGELFNFQNKKRILI